MNTPINFIHRESIIREEEIPFQGKKTAQQRLQQGQFEPRTCITNMVSCRQFWFSHFTRCFADYHIGTA